MESLNAIACTIASVGLGFLLLGVLLKFTGDRIMESPVKHDGIGGEDTNRVLGGCLGTMLGLFCVLCGGILVAIGAVLALMVYLVG